MKIETQFSVGAVVQVCLGKDEFQAPVEAVHVEVSKGIAEISYTVILPEAERGKGRNYTRTWRYRECYLSAIQ